MRIGGRGAGTVSFRSPDLAKLVSPVTWIGFLSCHLQSPLGARGGAREILAKLFWSYNEQEALCWENGKSSYRNRQYFLQKG